MKLKNTLILLAVALGIVGYIQFFEKGQPSSQEAADLAGRVVQFERDKIDAITIKNPETTIELHKAKDGGWLMEKPLKDHADAMAVNQLFTTAEALRSEALASDEKGATKDQLKEFGLASAETRVTFAGGAKPVEVLFGKDAAVEGKLYVRLEGSNVVHVIGHDLKTQVTKKTDEFRDHRLTGIVTTQVSKVAVKTAAGEIELGKNADQHWSLTKPLKARGDDQKIGDLISKAANAQVSAFAADAANLSAFGLQEPRGSVTLFTEGSEQPAVLQIGGAVEKEKDKIYVKFSARDAVCVVPTALAALLDTKPNDLRDRNLVRVEADIVDRITIEGADKGRIVLARSGESWVRKVDGKDQPINAAAATRLLAELRAQQVAGFVADVATELPKYGLDVPAVKVTLSSYASENTAETKAGERPIVSVLFGKTEEENVYAKLDDEPFVVSVPKGILVFAMTDPLQWQDLAIYKNKADDITSVEVAREGQPTLTLERDKDKKWALAKGDGKVNQTNAQSLVNTLAALRAVRWLGAVKPAHGLDKPAVSVAFKTGGGTGGKIIASAATPDGLHPASADGLTGCFAMSHPDFTAFELPLIDKPAAAPAPATPPPAPAAPSAETPAVPAPPTVPN